MIQEINHNGANAHRHKLNCTGQDNPRQASSV